MPLKGWGIEMSAVLEVRLEGFAEALAMYDHQVVRAAAYHAINRSVDGMVTDVSTEVRAAYNLKKSDVDKRFKKFKPVDYYNLVGGVQISGGPSDYRSSIPLVMFGAVGRRNLSIGSAKTMKGRDGYYSKLLKRKGQAGVTYKVLKAGGKGYSHNAFIIPGARGSMQVVRRTGSGKMSIVEMRTLTVASMVASRGHGVADKVMAKAQARFVKNFKGTLMYYMDRLSSGTNPGWGGMRRSA